MSRNWSGIEDFKLDDNNFVQVGYKNSHLGFREYVVIGMVNGAPFNEHYGSDNDDNKRLAYDLYWEKQEEILAV